MKRFAILTIIVLVLAVPAMAQEVETVTIPVKIKISPAMQEVLQSALNLHYHNSDAPRTLAEHLQFNFVQPEIARLLDEFKKAQVEHLLSSENLSAVCAASDARVNGERSARVEKRLADLQKATEKVEPVVGK